jgi:two-component system KDP operon response regulator KdpE
VKAAPRILIIDDDAGILQSLTAELHAAGYEVATARDGREGELALERSHPDLVLTDLAMPVRDGFALITAVRARADTPIIVLSVREREQDKVRALDLGADDYVAKPFSMPELLARVRAQLRRVGPVAVESVLEFPQLSIDLERRRVVQGGREVRLTPTEFALLELLARNAGKPLSFDRLIAKVWPAGSFTTHDTVRVHVGSLRRKLEPDRSNPRYLVTEPWVGYRFIAEPV